MKLWELSTLYTTEILVYNNPFLSKDFFNTHKYFGNLMVEINNYGNNIQIMNLKVPDEICLQYFSASKRLYFVRNENLMEYFKVDEVCMNIFEEINWENQKDIDIKDTITALEAYKEYGGSSMEIVLEKIRYFIPSHKP